jgi:hypothetical protein
MSRNAARRRVWALAWVVLFLAQFTLGRSVPDRGGLTAVAAVLQTLMLALPLVALFRGWGEPGVPHWPGNRVVWFISCLAAFTLAMNHLHAVRSLTATVVPYWLYVIGNWAGTLVPAVAVPLVAAFVLSAWMAARRAASWQIPDVLTVSYGSVVLFFFCFLNLGRHPFGRVAPGVEDAWQRLTCIVLPVALFVAAVFFWARSARRRTDASVRT